MRIVALLLATLLLTAGLRVPARADEPATRPATDSSVDAVTIYQGTALVTRKVAAPVGKGLMELIVTPLPPQTLEGSLYSEAPDGVRILSTRYRSRAVREDTRAEVRAIEDKIRAFEEQTQLIAARLQVGETNLQFLAKLEQFTAGALQQLSEKGMLNSEAIIALGKYVMESRGALADEQVSARQKMAEIARDIDFARRQLAELSAGAARTIIDAVIVVEKTADAPTDVRLNYLVSAATWTPQYKIRAADAQLPVHIEYLAAIMQQTGEDWTEAAIVLSNAQPMLNAAPPELLALNLAVNAAKPMTANAPRRGAQAKELRAQGQQRMNMGGDKGASGEGEMAYNQAAAIVQQQEMFDKEESQSPPPASEGPSVTYHLPTRFTVPSRSDPQLIEITRVQLPSKLYYKAIPVLTEHVYRLAALTNTTDQVLLPGEATMYLGSDFVGRMNLPLVAVGEQFTLAFGVDPQLQVERQQIDKSQAVQGGNQVHNFTYRLRVSSFKTEAVNVQLWDRLPSAEAQTIGITLTKTDPPLSDDPSYLRTDRAQNLLRWDIAIPADANREKAVTVTYSFKLEYARDTALGDLEAKR